MEKVWTVNRLPMGSEMVVKNNLLFQEAKNNSINFIAAKERIFDAKKIEIISKNKFLLNIPGRKGSIEGFYLVSQNISNSKPLSITIQRGRMEQNPSKRRELFVRDEAMISVSGEKSFDPTEKLEQSRGSFKRVPVRGPDLTSLDGMEFHKTGTLQIIIKQGALAILS